MSSSAPDEAMAQSSKNTAMPAIAVAIRMRSPGSSRWGMVWPRPPSVVIAPQVMPRSQGEPRPVSEPSSDNAGKPMLMPAPIRRRAHQNVCQLWCVASRGEQQPRSRPNRPSAANRLGAAAQEHAPPLCLLPRARQAEDLVSQRRSRASGSFPLRQDRRAGGTPTSACCWRA